SAKHDVGPDPGRDLVAAVDERCDRLHPRQPDRLTAEATAPRLRRCNEAVVPENEVLAVTGIDDVVARPAEEDVVSGPGADLVAAACRRVARTDRAEELCQPIDPVAWTTVSENLHDRAERIDIFHPATVAEYDVVAGPAGDRVVAQAAENHQRQ